MRHRLRYRMLTLLLDIDELPALSQRLRLFSNERFNLFSFRGADHLDGSAVPLRNQVEAHLAEAGITPDGGPIQLLCMPRVLGRVFNPLSVFFCYRADGPLSAVLYEVNNTFGQRHTYVIPAGDGDVETLRQNCAKRFYVSPFMDMAMQYHFRVALPQSLVAIAIKASDAKGAVLSACFAGERRSLTDTNLALGFLRHPLMATQVLCGIHWEALKLWLKGMRVQPRPAPPPEPISVVLPPRTV